MCALVLIIPVNKTSSSLNPFESVCEAASKISNADFLVIPLQGPEQNLGNQWPDCHWSKVTLYLPQRCGRECSPRNPKQFILDT